MLDSYTNTMCIDSWGRLDYARALIDVKAHRPFKDNMVIVIPYVEGSGFYLHTIKMVYEWKPPRCGSCAMFGHDVSKCPKHVVSEAGAKLGTDYQRQNDPSHIRDIAAVYDGFQVVQNLKLKGKQHGRNSLEALKENDNLFEYVGTSGVGNVGNTIQDANKVVEKTDSDVIYMMRLLTSWLVEMLMMPVYMRTSIMTFTTVMIFQGRVTLTWVLSTYLRSDSSVLDTELVVYLLQDKLTSRDKSLDLSAFKLFRLFFSLLSSGSSSCWRSYGA
ncbi:hypothetical protein Tco_1533021 [Tanacetum coccineum]